MGILRFPCRLPICVSGNITNSSAESATFMARQSQKCFRRKQDVCACELLFPEIELVEMNLACRHGMVTKLFRCELKDARNAIEIKMEE